MNDVIGVGQAVADLTENVRSAWRTFADYEAHLMTSGGEPEVHEEILEHEIEALYVHLMFILEALELRSLLVEFKDGFQRYRKNLTAISVSRLGEAYPPALEYIRRYASPLRAAFDLANPEVDKLQQLERILLGTPKIVRDRNIEPCRENDVRNALYELLLHVYPDTVREVPIGKVSKTYKPDIGIPSLKAAIEYKFATTAGELKKAIGGVFEDVGGYAGSEDWKNFFAVFYATDAFLTPAQVEAEFRLSGIDKSWTPLIVTGKGERRSRRPAKGG